MQSRVTSRLFLFVLAYAFIMSAHAQLENEPVAMDKAPFHVPIFTNDYITMLRINIPPGRDTGFHTHYFDSVSVNISPALRTNQFYGSTEIIGPSGSEPIPGRTAFNNVSERGIYTHKAVNTGPTPFRSVSFIFKDRNSVGAEVSDRSSVSGYLQIIDNNRVRAWRVILAPGERLGEITQKAPGLRIYVRGGVINELVPGSPSRGMAPYSGNFIWQDSEQTREIINTGSTIVEFVEFEFK
ncbi:MAG: hypothetical protein CMM56_03205 [Rhodospirillaceae bacterium]|nr:hypothetical protein [Rhodospirillaceae bacterium]